MLHEVFVTHKLFGLICVENVGGIAPIGGAGSEYRPVNK